MIIFFIIVQYIIIISVYFFIKKRVYRDPYYKNRFHWTIGNTMLYFLGLLPIVGITILMYLPPMFEVCYKRKINLNVNYDFYVKPIESKIIDKIKKFLKTEIK